MVFYPKPHEAGMLKWSLNVFKNYSPIDDAAVYYTNRVGKNTNAILLERLVSNHPESRQRLEAVLKTSIELERMLDMCIPVLDSECEFFFGLDRFVNGDDQPLWNLAMLVIGYRAGLSDKAADSRTFWERRLSVPLYEKNRLFLSYLLDLGEESAKELIAHAGESDCVLNAFAKSRLDPLTRIKLTELYLHWEMYVKRLSKILDPAAELIGKETDIYANAVKELLSSIDAEGDLCRYMKNRYGIGLGGSGKHVLHIIVLAPNIINIRDGIFDSKDIYLGTGVAQLSELLYSGRESERLAAIFKLLSDGTRLEMLRAIAVRPMYGQELAEAFPVKAPTVSYHMTKLVASGLAESYFEGGKCYFKANMQSLEALEKSIGSFFMQRIK